MSRPHDNGSRYLREAFRKFFSRLPKRDAYCVDCLSRFFEEPPETIRDFLDGAGDNAAECGSCRQHKETFRPSTSLG